jgi:SNF2 family DNA or RNA helicase
MYLTWPAEIKKWTDFNELSYTIVHGKDKAYNLGLPTDIHLINPEGVAWLIKNHPTKLLQYDVLVIDESRRFGNTQTQRFKLLKPFIPNFKRRWILTGTPAPNGAEDLFGQVYILDLGRALGRFITHFRRDFFYLAGFNLYDWRLKEDSWPRITERISPLVLQMSAEDYLQMPDLILIRKEITLPDSVRKLYDDLDREFLANWGEEELVANNKAIVGGKLRQVANGALYREDHTWVELHDAKLDALESLLQEIQGPALVVYEFIHDRDRILSRIGPVPVLGGGVSRKSLEDTVELFNAGELPVLLGHPRSMGHGLNLQGACHHIIMFGITWDLELYDQVIARVYRQGQESDHVFVYHIIAKDTKDEEVMEILDSKDRTQQGFLKGLNAHRRENYGEE